MKTEQQDIRRIALLTAVASVLQISESYLPHPVPGVRLGLANMITLVALLRMGPAAAIEIAVLRTLVSSFVLGTFLSPSFILSFSAALASSVVMSIFYRVLVPARLPGATGPTSGRAPLFSAVGVSLVGSVTHNLVQIALVYWLIVKNPGVFLLLPWLGISAVVMGWISGLVAMKVCDRLDAPEAAGRGRPGEPGEALPGTFPPLSESASLLTGVPGWIKVAGALAVAVAAVAVKAPAILGGILVAILILMLVSRTSPGRIIQLTLRLAPLVLFGCSMPILFTRHGAVVASAGPLAITREGLHAGAIVALRLFLLMTNGALLMRTTPPDQLAKGLATLFSPLNLVGLPVDRATAAISLSLACLPGTWHKAREAFNLRKLREQGLRKTLDELSSAMAVMYDAPSDAPSSPGRK